MESLVIQSQRYQSQLRSSRLMTGVDITETKTIIVFASLLIAATTWVVCQNYYNKINEFEKMQRCSNCAIFSEQNAIRSYEKSLEFYEKCKINTPDVCQGPPDKDYNIEIVDHGSDLSMRLLHWIKPDLFNMKYPYDIEQCLNSSTKPTIEEAFEECGPARPWLYVAIDRMVAAYRSML